MVEQPMAAPIQCISSVASVSQALMETSSAWFWGTAMAETQPAFVLKLLYCCILWGHSSLLWQTTHVAITLLHTLLFWCEDCNTYGNTVICYDKVDQVSHLKAVTKPQVPEVSVSRNTLPLFYICSSFRFFSSFLFTSSLGLLLLLPIIPFVSQTIFQYHLAIFW